MSVPKGLTIAQLTDQLKTQDMVIVNTDQAHEVLATALITTPGALRGSISRALGGATIRITHITGSKLHHVMVDARPEKKQKPKGK